MAGPICRALTTERTGVGVPGVSVLVTRSIRSRLVDRVSDRESRNSVTTHRQLLPPRVLLNKVPQITLYFWVIKVLCTTVGETAADFLNVSLNFGLTGTSIATGVLLVVALVIQFRATRYSPGRY